MNIQECVEYIKSDHYRFSGNQNIHGATVADNAAKKSFMVNLW